LRQSFHCHRNFCRIDRSRYPESAIRFVIVDELNALNLPTLGALSTLARDKFVIAGDPFQVEPESALTDKQHEYWLERIFFSTWQDNRTASTF